MSLLQHKLKQAQALCASKGAELTALRCDVLELIYNSDVPVGAYELLRQLRSIRPNAEPPTIYRALEFLQKQHLIHRIATDNAYVACEQPQHAHHGHFLLCKKCGLALELNDERIHNVIAQCAKEKHFQIENHCTEIVGMCAKCYA